MLLAGPAATATVSSTDAAGADAVRADSAPEAADILADGDVSVLVLDLGMDGAADLFERLRTGAFGRSERPVVFLVDDPDGVPARSFDAVLEKPVSEGELRAALDRAEAVVAYRDAVETLYERCRSRAATGEADPLSESPDLAAARSAADEALDTLDDPGVVADLLASDE